MFKCKEIYSICKLNFNKLIVNPRVLFGMLVYLTIMIFQILPEMRNLCDMYQVGIAPLPLFLYASNERFPMILGYLCWLMCVCDAPFIDDLYPSVVIRTGKRMWSAGNLVYIAIAAVVFWSAMVFFSIVAMGGRVEWTLDWGRVYRSLAMDCPEELRWLMIDSQWIENFSASNLFILNMLLKIGTSVFLAEIIYLINLLSNKPYGVVVAMIIVLFHGHFYDWFVSSKLLFYSPVSLSSLNCLQLIGEGILPTLQYSFLFFLVAIVMLTSFCIIAADRK